MVSQFRLSLALTIFLGPVVCCGQEVDQLRLVLPTQIYAVVGLEMNVYFDNIVLTDRPEEYRFEMSCDIGKAGERRWTVTPTAKAVGDHELSVTISDRDTGKQLAKAATKLRVIAADAGAERAIKLLIIGDSLTHATAYPNEIARLLAGDGNPSWKMLGTHQPRSAAKDVAHEGYGGWTWQRFATKYEPNPDGTHRKRSSPFVYLVDGQPRLDLDRYWKQECGDRRPDYVIIMLGINDCFSAPAESPDGRIDAMFEQADVLLKAIQDTAPQCEIGICLTTPPNAREAAFEANYKGRYSRWNWKQIQHRLVQRQIERFAKSKQAKRSIIPTQLNLDPIDGYPTNNGVHPNAAGYKQIGASIYAWLKWRLDEASRSTATNGDK